MKAFFSSVAVRVFLGAGIASATGQTIVVPQIPPTPIQVPQIVVPQVQVPSVVVPKIVRDAISVPVVRATPIPPTPVLPTPVVINQIPPTPALQLSSPGNLVPPQTILQSSAQANPRRESFFSLPRGLYYRDPNPAELWNAAVYGAYPMMSPAPY